MIYQTIRGGRVGGGREDMRIQDNNLKLEDVVYSRSSLEEGTQLCNHKKQNKKVQHTTFLNCFILCGTLFIKVGRHFCASMCLINDEAVKKRFCKMAFWGLKINPSPCFFWGGDFLFFFSCL